jgi:DNA polymerase elongation subunit (family B)
VELRLAFDEAGLFDALVALVAGADPDFLVGWEVQMASLGYLLERAQHLGLPGLLRRLSRVRASGRQSSSAAAAGTSRGVFCVSFCR